MPLLERVKFCSIFSSNLDEFFMVRVAGLMGQEAAGVPVRSADGRTPSATLAAIRERMLALTVRQSKLWSRELVPALKEAGIDMPRSTSALRRSWPSSSGTSTGRSTRC